MRVGTVTTGEPGTYAAVVNSGTEQDVVLEFTIPRGDTGVCKESLQLLAAYSTPVQGGTSGKPLLFDINGLHYGTAISHTAGSGTFTINQPGVYAVAFHGGVGPAGGADFPLSILTYLTENGASVGGAGAPHTFHTSKEFANVSFSIPIAVSSVPTTLKVIGEGGKFLYGANTLTIYRLGDIPV